LNSHRVGYDSSVRNEKFDHHLFSASLRNLSVVIALALAACSDSRDWREFHWPDGEFKVLLPGKPHREAREISIGEFKLAMQLFPIRVEGLTFAAGYAPLPGGMAAGDRAKLLEAARDAFGGNLGAKDLSSKVVMINANPGLAFAGTGERDGKSLAIAGRVVATDQRFYQAIVVGAATRAGDAEIALFLESLVIGPAATRAK
jgi:hypothetical protein